MSKQGEQRILDGVFHYVFCDDPISNKNFKEASDDYFLAHSYLFSTDRLHKCIYGFINTEIPAFLNSIRQATPNPKPNDFPDFLLPDGFIEHFEVTSSECIRHGGAKQKMAEGELNKRIQKDIEKQIDENNGVPIIFERLDYDCKSIYPQHKYEYFVDSFQKNFESHLNSLRKYKGIKNDKIFLIYYPDYALSMLENVYKDVKKGVQIGDLREQQNFTCYRLSRDKAMLNYLYGFKDKVDVVIFVNCEGIVELIKVANIPEILKMLPWDFLIKESVNVSITHHVFYSSIPCENQENKNEPNSGNDK